MADFPETGFCQPVINVFSKHAATSSLMILANASAAGSSAAWPSAGRAIYVPIWLPARFPLRAFWCANGATVSGANNIDMGILSPGGALIASTGSTAHSGTSTLQIVTLGTPVMLMPGRCYMALSCSNTAETFQSRTPSTAIQTRMGVLQAASQVPLTTGPTFATPASAYLPIFGISQITTF